MTNLRRISILYWWAWLGWWTEATLAHSREGFFNSTSYVSLYNPLLLSRHIGLSFRTCKGGQLFAQTQRSSFIQTISLDVRPEGLVFTVLTLKQKYESRISLKLLDNEWHTVNILYRMGNLTISTSGYQQVIANSTYNSEILSHPEVISNNDVLVVGKGFVGCILEGPSIVFNTSQMQFYNVEWGPCPLPNRACELVDHCSNEPCMRHGRCIRLPDRYLCQCTARYSGSNCQIDNGPPCEKFPCRNNGQCFESPNGDFTCHCPPGFAGRTCETEIPLSQICENNFPCLNNGTCQVSGASYACICKPGFEGKDCEMNINECLSMPCLHGGTCIDGINEFKCLCGNSGYTGQMCEININECENNPCLNNGVCFDNYGGYTCQCSAGFGGQNCELKLSECASNPCPYPNSMCIDSNLSYQCICRSGYIGIPPNCTRNEPCSNVNPCLNGGTCIASDEGYSCQCLPSFTGALCENSLDNCFSQPCLNGGICTNTPGGYLCNCSAEFTGPNCELPSDPCAHHPCQNNGTCMPTTGSNGVRGFYCECADTGFEGTHCENNINDCLNENCPEGKICVDGINTFKCQDPSEALKCSPNPCKNHGTCLEGVPDQTCLCPPGWKGEFCEQDIDECENPQLCVHGICRNTNGTYQCFCTPGYSGDHCEIDFDECLSHPCFNGASCLNLINGFECVCTPGFTGKECKVNINECDSNPCKNNARCIDEIATFSCVCPEGFTGRLCEENIDDCASSPCLHGGRCIDGLNSYTCDCIETGYNGPHCEINIDECMSDPCLNGAECIDQIRDYTCNCYPGFTGKNCETDINECASNPCENNGVCTEYSSISPSSYYRNTSVYGSTNPPVEKDYSNLAGYYCSCNPGFTGANCEIDINECESSPCKHGSCLDKFNGYSCVCEEGYEGEHCETDIDECERYKPCVHGICQDRPANYICECDSKYGGKNCSVELTGCQKNQCMNGGTCIPYLDSEIHHLFNCSCPHGYQGPTCEKDTTMFFDGDSYGIVKTNREEGYDIRLRFKTTLPDGLLALGTGSTFYILELAKGRLNLHSSLLNKWEGVFIGSHLNNSEWQQVFVNINSTHLVLAANQEQTIYPINLNEGATQSHTSFATTYLGGAMSYLRNLPHGPSIFRGCFQDVMINGQWVVLPVPANSTSISLKGVQVGCKREPQCSPNPCHSGGHCTDLWNNFSCSCERPFLGNKCQYNYTAATFGHENITDSVVTVTVDPASRRAVRAVMDISMFIRTREPYGGIFYLGSKPGTVPKLEETIIAAKLSQGELHVSIQFNGSLESYSVAGVRIDTGYNQLIQVIRNVTLIQIKINGTEFFRKTITVTGQLDLQILQLGSIHPLSDGERNFKGIIQDVQMSNGTRTMVVQFFPLPPDRDFEPPLSLGQVDIDTTRVLRGIVSDENCRSEPCMHGGVCTVTWNDFSCKCPVGYKGKQCQEMEFCQMQDCPEGSECRNLNHGYECVTNITLHNTDTNAPGLRYTLVQSEEDKGNLNLNDISIAYRSRTGGNLLFIGPDAQENYLAISVYEDQIHFDWNLGFGGEHFKIAKETNDGAWTNIWVKIQEKTITGGIIAATEELFAGGNTRYLSANASQEAWNSLLTTSNISIGGSRDVFNIFRSKYTTTTADQTNSLDNVQPPITAPDDPSLSVYQGCIGEVRIGGLLLSYFTSEELNATNTLRNHFELIAGSSLGQQLGCVLCFEEECQNGGKCKNSSVSYICDCVPGFVGEDCSTNYDECIENDCKNNSTCIDGLAKYTCECQPGWEGPLCDNDIDECASGPCQNNATCKDELAKFVCVCPPEYVGETCAQLKNITCETKPCFNGADCKDVFNPLTKDNYTCICPEGFLGSKCEMAFCDSPTTPCVNYGQCISETSEPFCNCSIGFTGKFCETNIDDCENEPCAHGGKCIDGIGSFMCNCSGTGYTGPFCNVDIDECAAMLADCGRFGECQNTEGSFYCQCVPGFCGRGCKLTDPCYTNNPCDHGSTCAPMCTDKPDYKCFCPPDYKGKNCSEAEGLQFSSSNVTDIALVVVPILGILLIAAVVSLIIFVMMARKKRATRGTYSPSNQEFSNPRLELDNVMKPPPEERLI